MDRHGHGAEDGQQGLVSRLVIGEGHGKVRGGSALDMAQFRDTRRPDSRHRTIEQLVHLEMEMMGIGT